MRRTRIICAALLATLLVACRGEGSNSRTPDRGAVTIGMAGKPDLGLVFRRSSHTFDAANGSSITLRKSRPDGWTVEILWPADAPVAGDTTADNPSVILTDPSGVRFCADSLAAPFGVMDVDIGSTVFATIPGEMTEGILAGTLEEEGAGLQVIELLNGNIISARE